MTFARTLSIALLLVASVACSRNQTPSDKDVAVKIEAARQTALTRVPGEIQKEKLDEDDGRWVYEFDIKTTATGPGAVQEVVVDASNGQILKVEADDD